MSFNLMTVFKNSDLQKFGQTASNVISLAFKIDFEVELQRLLKGL